MSFEKKKKARAFGVFWHSPKEFKNVSKNNKRLVRRIYAGIRRTIKNFLIKEQLDDLLEENDENGGESLSEGKSL